MQSFVQAINTDFAKLSTNENLLEAKGLCRSFVANMLENQHFFVAKVHLILSHLKTPKNLRLTFDLLANNRFCQGSSCYQHHRFTLDSNDVLTIDTEKVNLGLQKIVNVSCTLLPNLKTSIVHDEKFIIKDDVIIPMNPSLPNMKFNDLYSKKINELTRNVQDEDLLLSMIFPVYNQGKISFWCLTPRTLQIDNIQTPCTYTGLTFIDIPDKIKLKDNIVWSKLIDNLRPIIYFLKKIQAIIIWTN